MLLTYGLVCYTESSYCIPHFTNINDQSNLSQNLVLYFIIPIAENPII